MKMFVKKKKDAKTVEVPKYNNTKDVSQDTSFEIIKITTRIVLLYFYDVA